MSGMPSLEGTCLSGSGLKKAGSFLGGQDPYVKLYVSVSADLGHAALHLLNFRNVATCVMWRP